MPVLTPERRRRLNLDELVARHPLRARILEAAAQREVSPVELAELWGESLGVVAYHVRRLYDAGGLELARESRVRGAVQHHYRATCRGATASESTPLARAIAALETILERYEIGALESIPSVAQETLDSIRPQESDHA